MIGRDAQYFIIFTNLKLDCNGRGYIIYFIIAFYDIIFYDELMIPVQS